MYNIGKLCDLARFLCDDRSKLCVYHSLNIFNYIHKHKQVFLSCLFLLVFHTNPFKTSY